MNRNRTKRSSTATLSTVDWRLGFLLGTVVLVRPIASILGLSDGGPWVPILTSIAITVLWIGVVVRSRVRRPVETLAFAGAVYGCVAIVLGIALRGSLTVPAFAVPAVIVTNLVWGLAAGIVAAGIERARGR